MRKLPAVLLSIAVVGIPLPRPRANHSDAFGGNVQPNVLFLIDSSQRMDDCIDLAATAPYDAGTTYPASWPSTKVYNCPPGQQCENNPSR